MMTIRISNSSRSTFGSCKRKFFYNKLGVRPRRVKEVFKVGKLWHEFLAESYVKLNMDSGLKVLNNYLDKWEFDVGVLDDEEEQVKFQKNKILLLEMAEQYKPVFEKDIEGMTVLGVEIPFRISVRKNKRSKKFLKGFSLKLLNADLKEYKTTYELLGVIDLVYKKDGIYYIMEHKTTSRDPELYDKVKVSSYQTLVYKIAVKLMLEKHGILNPEIQMVYNITKKAYPKTPKTVQCRKCKGTGSKKGEVCEVCNGTGVGGLSKVKIDTSYSKVMEVLDKYPHLNKNDYSELLDYLKDKPDLYHFRTFTSYSKEEIHDFMNELYLILKDMKQYENKSKEYHYRTMGFLCTDCPYSDLCFYDLDPEDSEMFDVIDSNFPIEYKETIEQQESEVLQWD